MSLALNDEHMLVGYVEGNDLHDVAPLLRSRFRQLIESRTWSTKSIVFVDQVRDPDPQSPDWLPDLDLGLNFGLDHIGLTDNWFERC